MKINIAKLSIYLISISLAFLLFSSTTFALTPGTLVYRTSSNGQMYGYSTDNLLDIDYGILHHIYPGHVGIYVGEENGEHYIVEALADGVVKTPAKYFVNESLGEKFIGAKIPIYARAIDRLKAVKLAKSLAEYSLGYDFNFKKQKGPKDGDWTCVGLVEKIYESAGISNPANIHLLEYNPNNYKINITADGYDNKSYFNGEGDCFSEKLEFSKISRRTNLVLPSPEKIGFNAGREYQGERYFFLPYTQFLQDSLMDQTMDIQISSSFKEKDIRGKTPTIGLILRWSLVNNPMSSIKAIATKVKEVGSQIGSYLFHNKEEVEIAITPEPEREVSSVKTDQEANRVLVSKIEPAQISNVISEGAEDLKIDVNSDNKQEESVIMQKNDNDKVRIITDTSKIEEKNDNKNIKTDEIKEVKLKENKVTEEYSSSQIETVNISKLTAAEKKNQSISSIQEKKNDIAAILPSSKIITGDEPEGVAIPSNIPAANNSAPPPRALISKIYSTGMNDFIELYNPTDYDFDLAESGFRIEKTKTADNPSIVMRIGNDADGLYPGGTVISARGYYLIVRDDASQYFLNMADAVGTRSEFGWTGDGYTLYIGKAAISSSIDEDIIDAVGFGHTATYFRGTAPAPEIVDNYYLDRINEHGDNSLDFELVPSGDPSIEWDDYIDEDSNNDDEQDDETNNQNNNEEENTNDDNENDNEDDQSNEDDDENDNNSSGVNDFIPYVFAEPITSSGITNLWHFSECYGEQSYTVGRFDCGIQIGGQFQAFKPILSSEIDLNEFSISFYYRDTSSSSASPRLAFKLQNNEGQWIQVQLQRNLLQIDGLPNSAWRYYQAPIFDDEDNSWRHFSLVVDKDNNYWAVYINGAETYKHSFIESLPSNFSSIEFTGNMGSVGLDELAIWNRSLSKAEVASNYFKAAPFAPTTTRISQKPAELKYFWNFNEGHERINEGGGTTATDEISGLDMDLPANSWIWRGEENTGIVNTWQKNITVDLPAALNRKDLSLGFWWRSNFHPEEGRSVISLNYNDLRKLALEPSYFRRSYYFNNGDGVFSQGMDLDLPHDENWHYFTLTYDSYRYVLKLYIDGEEKSSRPYIWIKDGEEPNRLSIVNELNKVELDDIAIWEGVLTPNQIMEIYEESKVGGS